MTAVALRAGPILRKTDEAGKNIPYTSHVTANTVVTDDDYIQVIRCDGAAFESADDSDLNSWHKNLNTLYRSIADPRISLWFHLIRDDENSYPDGEFPPGFADEFNKKYAEKVSKELLMVNELYVTIVFRPQTSKVGRGLFKLFEKTDDSVKEQERLDSLEYINKVTNEVLSGLNRYEPTLLGTYQYNGQLFSEVNEFFAYLVNFEWQRIPLARAPISQVLATSRPIFGNETIEIRTPTRTMFGATLGIKEYPPETSPGVLNQLLTVPFPFVLTQSFTFLTKESAKWVVKTQRNRMTNTDDDAKSQIEEMDELLDDISSNRIVFGNHHFTLLVRGDTVKELTQNISDARIVLGDAGMLTTREDLAVEAAYWAQLPANFKFRPRLSPITSRNLAGLSPFHNYPSGRRSGNHWGDAMTLLVTDANTPLYFSLHASDPTAEDGGSRKDVADTLLLGPKGAGKTVVVTAMATFLQKFGLTSVFFTKDRDSEIIVRALRGKYMALKMGERTGCNPFHLEPSMAVIQMWNTLVQSLVKRELALKDEMQIQAALNWMVESVPQEERRLGVLLDYLDKTDPDGVHAHLRQWCYARRSGEQDGIYAWVFDNRVDTVAEVVSGSNKTVGFDITDFLEHEIIRGPLLFYLMYLVEGLIDGRRLGVFISEFWKPLDDPKFAKKVKDWLKTIRKKNGFVCLDSQSPSDALAHKDARTLIEQTATKILFPNPDADYNEYRNGLSLSEREFLLIKEEIPLGSRKFLVKQGGNSVVAKLDLKGFDFELDVLSGRSANIELVEQLIKQYGDDPDVWLPLFKDQRKKA